jgi:phosphotransferase system HPr-like phosphotransfer protein
VKDSQCFSAKSILEVLSANLNRGTVFTLRAEGRDAREAVEALGDLLRIFAHDEH